MEITYEMRERLAELIFEAVSTDFEYVHLAQNLVATMNIYSEIVTYVDPDSEEKVTIDKVVLDMPAPRYSISTYLRTGAVVYTGRGSYANTVNKHGGFSKKHKNYVERAISVAINRWLMEYGLKGVVK